jgi:hypothetical protein
MPTVTSAEQLPRQGTQGSSSLAGGRIGIPHRWERKTHINDQIWTGFRSKIRVIITLSGKETNTRAPLVQLSPSIHIALELAYKMVPWFEAI